MNDNRISEEFLTNISREIRSSINVVTGMAELVLREDISPNVKSCIMQIKSSGEALLTVIDDEISMYGMSMDAAVTKPVDYDMVSVLEDVTDAVRGKAWEKGVQLHVNVTPSLPGVLHGDRRYLRQMLLKLAGVAVGNVPGHDVSINTDYEKSEDGIILCVDTVCTGGADTETAGRDIESDISMVKGIATKLGGGLETKSCGDGGFCFSLRLPQGVTDETPIATLNNPDNIVAINIFADKRLTGSFEDEAERLGIAAIGLGSDEDIEQMYEAIVSTSPNSEVFLFMDAGEYTAAVDGIIARHPELTAVMLTDMGAVADIRHGNMLAVSKPVSTVDMVRIFNHERVSGQITAADSTDGPEEFTAPDAMILVVDDDPVNLLVAEGLLEPFGMKLDKASGAREALKKAGENKYDLIFMDYMMPELNGVETMKLIRQSHPEYNDVPIIALTATVEAGIREIFKEEGMDDYVPKPIEMKTLISKVRQWLPPELIITGTPAAGSSSGELKALLDRMRTAVDDLDSDAMDKAANEMMGLSLDDEQKTFREALKEAVDDIDTERCEELLNKWEALLQ